MDKTHIGLDFFDATISRTAAWVVGVRNMQKALLRALLMPQARLKAVEAAGDFTARLVLTEELRDLPFAAVWQEACTRANLPIGSALLRSLEEYQSGVAGRG